VSTQTSELVLNPPQPIAAISPTQADGMIELDDATKQRLDRTVDGYVDALTRLDATSPELQRKVDSVHTLGDKEIRQSASVSNRMLDRPVRAMGSGLFDKDAPVATSLIELRRTIDDLDPAKQGLFSKRRLFGLIPFGDRLRDYFAKYQSAQTHLNAILQSLYQGQDELRQDNAAIEQEKANLWTTMDRLMQYAYMAAHLDAALETKIAALQATEPAKAKVLQQDVLFYVRQKDQDLLTQLAVGAQGYLALELIRKNNVEVIKGVDRATTTTVSALRTAVMVAQALANQRLVLDQIAALNTTTENMIASTSEMLRDQSGRVHEQAASSTIAVDKLQAAFDNVYASIDAIDSYKAQALDSMKQTVDALQTEVGKAQASLEHAKGDGTAAGAGELALGT
jgi:uncharacterized protein YaaN involved in tellurite resistance